MLDAGWTVVPDSANFNKRKISIPTKEIKEAGFMYVYLSYENESNNYVYFDDFKVTHTKTNVIQYNEYYPFGLSASTSWTREDSKNDFLYNAGNELNSTTGWYEMFFRGYDPALGRMLQVDPYAAAYSSHTPYNYGANNPVNFNDPSGGLVDATGLTDSQLRALYHANMWRGYTSLSGQYGGYSSYDAWASDNVTGLSLGVGGGGRRNTDYSAFWNEVLSLPAGTYLRNTGDGTFEGYGDAYSVSGGFFGQGEIVYIDGVAGEWIAELYSIGIPEGNNVHSGAQQGGPVQQDPGWDLNNDGRLSLSEANNWYRSGNGQAITIPLSTLDLTSVRVVDFRKGVGSTKSFSLFINSNSYNDMLVFGSITLRLYPDNTVRAFSDTYDFDLRTGLNPLNWPRNAATAIGEWVAGDGMPFQIHLTGSAYITYESSRVNK